MPEHLQAFLLHFVERSGSELEQGWEKPTGAVSGCCRAALPFPSQALLVQPEPGAREPTHPCWWTKHPWQLYLLVEGSLSFLLCILGRCLRSADPSLLSATLYGAAPLGHQSWPCPLPASRPAPACSRGEHRALMVCRHRSAPAKAAGC